MARKARRSFGTLAFQAADRIAQILIKHDKLKAQALHLNLGDKRLGSDGTKALGKGLEQLTGRQTLHLDLENNFLGGQALGNALGKALEQLIGLQTLNLQLPDKSFRAEGAQALGEALEQLAKLQTLCHDLDDTPFRSEGAQALGEASKEPTGFQTCCSL